MKSLASNGDAGLASLRHFFFPLADRGCDSTRDNKVAFVPAAPTTPLFAAQDTPAAGAEAEAGEVEAVVMTPGRTRADLVGMTQHMFDSVADYLQGELTGRACWQDRGTGVWRSALFFFFFRDFFSPRCHRSGVHPPPPVPHIYGRL